MTQRRKHHRELCQHSHSQDVFGFRCFCRNPIEVIADVFANHMQAPMIKTPRNCLLTIHGTFQIVIPVLAIFVQGQPPMLFHNHLQAFTRHACLSCKWSVGPQTSFSASHVMPATPSAKLGKPQISDPRAMHSVDPDPDVRGRVEATCGRLLWGRPC